MKLKIKLLLVTASLAFAFPASAQESVLAYLVQSCQSDLEQYCSTVTPGGGRLLHCVAAHEDKLSGQCSYALYQAASLLEELAVAIAYVATSCETEIKSMCADVEVGEGRIAQCLADNSEELGGDCKTALANTVGE